MIGTALLLVLLIALSAFFSGSEIAIFSLGTARVRSLCDEGRRGAGALSKLKSNPERLLATILVGNNIVNISAASVATAFALNTFGNQGVAYATGVITLLVLVFGEITPKGFASANNVRIGLLVAPTLLLLSRVLAPIVVPFEQLTRFFVRRSRAAGAPTITEGEIRESVAIGHQEGTINAHERQIIERAFWLDDTRAWDIMAPRVEIFAWPAHLPLSAIAGELPTVRFSRVPVYRESIDDIVGVLYTRDAYQALLAGQRDVPLGELAREPLFVPGSISLSRLLTDFQTRRIHMGVVIDEYGGTDGLVTLEDVLEELVGEIVDETDVERQPIVRVSRNEVVVEGGADLREINHFLNTSLPQLEHRSLNGYLLDELGRVPDVGEEIVREGVRIRIEQSSDTQVLRARLTRVTPVAAEPATGGAESGAGA
ncbi:MAG TPA: hemolysin family protein [Longimicrobiaceae bacterium]|nr:hemolysin family protein [Longimicrobiaceae bacterium]